ncbi:HAD family hydrolase [Butyrivibrio sp. MB2005]|uniref:HAD family hydrolase n=1 Tax=Butyrivibrio sp. MB2005 TaxID=1280678 RepID=UPI00041281BA|nr:HAD family hydrolase [Butyrivibrio sp. MB2005]
MSKIKAVIFDLDGTLLYTLEDLMLSANYALSKHGMETCSLHDIQYRVGNGVQKLMERCVPGGLENPDFQAVFADFKEHYKVHCNDNSGPYKGIPELLTALKEKGYKLAIVSNKFMDATKELAALYFKDTIDVAIGESAGIRKKPEPDTVIEAMRILGVTASDCVYVGDSDVDIKTAANSGMPCISVAWGFRTREEQQEAGGKIFADVPDDIIKLLEFRFC